MTDDIENVWSAFCIPALLLAIAAWGWATEERRKTRIRKARKATR